MLLYDLLILHSALEQARDAADKQKRQSSRKRDGSSADISKNIPYSSIVLPKKVFKKIASIEHYY